MSTSIAIVDDDDRWIDDEKNTISEFLEKTRTEHEYHVLTFHSGQELIDSSSVPDLVFLDVEMDGLDGFETAALYQKRHCNSRICFLTTHTELGRKGYLVNAFRYIDKAHMAEEIPEALRSYFKTVAYRDALNHRIMVTVKGIGNQYIRENDLRYIEKDGRHLIIHTNVGELVCLNSLQNIESQFKSENFLKVYKSIVINLAEVYEITHDHIELIDKTRLPITIKRYTKIKKVYMKFVLDQGSE